MPHSDNIIFTNSENFREVFSKYIGETEKNFFLADENTHKHCYPLIKKLFPGLDDERVIVIDAGDDEKNITSLHHIWSFLLHHGANRQSRLINLGGGMITDIGGFAASTFMRGIPYVHIPTSLLGMVDAAIGGKTAINIGKIKNQAGTFARAEAVIIHPQFLEPLPWDEFLSGYSEILKTAIAFNKNLFEELKQIRADRSHPQAFIDRINDGIIQKTVAIKAEVTAKDFLDQADRQCLNFGHSVGHALEALYFSNGDKIKHGYAVAAGMLCEAFISKQILKLREEDYLEIEKYILCTFPKVHFREEDIDGIINLIRHDKKNFRDDIRMSLIEARGKCRFGISCPEGIIKDSLKHYLEITGV